MKTSGFVRLWNHVWYRPASALSLVACRVIVSAHALWILLSRPDIPDLAAWPGEFWLQAGRLPLRFGIVGLHPGVEQALFGLLHASLFACLIGLAPRMSAAFSAALLYHFAPFEEIIVGMPHTSFGGLTLPVLALFILAFAERPLRRQTPSPEYRWPLALIQLLLAFHYLFPTLAKLRFSGPDWFTADNMRSYLLGNHPITGAPWATAVASVPTLCWLIALGTLALELLSPLVVVSARFATLFAGAALAFHLGILETVGYFFPSLPLLLVYVDWDGIHRWAARHWPREESAG